MGKYDVAAYVWPAYTGRDKRSLMFWPEGMGEWQSVKNSVKKFPEHSWPRKPLWGYVDEADHRRNRMKDWKDRIKGDYSDLRGVCHNPKAGQTKEKMAKQLEYAARLNLNAVRFWMSQEEWKKKEPMPK